MFSSRFVQKYSNDYEMENTIRYLILLLSVSSVFAEVSSSFGIIKTISRSDNL